MTKANNLRKRGKKSKINYSNELTAANAKTMYIHNLNIERFV